MKSYGTLENGKQNPWEREPGRLFICPSRWLCCFDRRLAVALLPDPAARPPLHWFGMSTTRCTLWIFPPNQAPLECSSSGARVQAHVLQHFHVEFPCQSIGNGRFRGNAIQTGGGQGAIVLLSSPRSPVTSNPGGRIPISITVDADITQPIKREASVNSCVAVKRPNVAIVDKDGPD